jgi:hypothetical protein
MNKLIEEANSKKGGERAALIKAGEEVDRDTHNRESIVGYNTA